MSSITDRHLAALPGDARHMIDALRAIVQTSAPTAVETIKWNAPSFAVDGEDRITLGLDRKGGARLVLHLGAKPRDPMDLTVVDPCTLARWPSPDRGVVTFQKLEEIRRQEGELIALCSRWIAATASL